MTPTTIIRIATLALALPACDGPEPGEPARDGSAPAEAGWRYETAITFVGLGDGVLAAPFSFAVEPRGERHERMTRAWLARGESWDPFLEAVWSAPVSAGVWRVVPHDQLRLAAGPAGLEALWYDSGGRRLRLELGEPRSTWQGGDRKRFRLLESTLRVGSEAVPGVAVEELQVTRAEAADAPAVAHDRFVLVDDEGFRLYLLHEREAGGAPEAGGTSWVYTGGPEDAFQEANVDWVELRTIEEARRDIPVHWRFGSTEAGVQGEVTAVGQHVTVGAERGGRRAVEVHYTVEGWVDRWGERVEVRGVLRHFQG